jgi:hypothetical protein
MGHRPRPSIERALHQLARHNDETQPNSEPRPMTPFERQLLEGAQAAVRSLAPLGDMLRAALRGQ